MALLVPRVESVLAFAGATAGTVLSYILPAALALRLGLVVGSRKHVARALFWGGIVLLVTATWTTKLNLNAPSALPVLALAKHSSTVSMAPIVPSATSRPAAEDTPPPGIKTAKTIAANSASDSTTTTTTISDPTGLFSTVTREKDVSANATTDGAGGSGDPGSPAPVN